MGYKDLCVHCQPGLALTPKPQDLVILKGNNKATSVSDLGAALSAGREVASPGISWYVNEGIDCHLQLHPALVASSPACVGPGCTGAIWMPFPVEVWAFVGPETF